MPPVVNIHAGETSDLPVTRSGGGSFPNTVDVQYVKDLAHTGLRWDSRKVSLSSDQLTLTIRLTARASSGKVKDDAVPPDSGNLTVTLTDGTGGSPPPVDPVPVTYTDSTT
jgi:hypothetical protein